MGLEDDFRTWLKTLPYARAECPTALGHRLVRWFWDLYTPLHPFIRDTLTGSGLLQHDFRQDFLLGTFDRTRSLRAFVEHLIEQGFGRHSIAWKDSGEVFGFRRTDGFRRQYHIRVFTDGEVRGHYEYTPEYSPMKHLLEIDFEDRHAEFLEMLSDWVIPAPAFAAVADVAA